MDIMQFNERSAAIIHLQERGYDMDFIFKNEFLFCVQDRELISPDDFEITESYLFEDTGIPGESNMIFAVYLINTGLKGILMTSCGALCSGLSIHLWSRFSGKVAHLFVCNR